MIKKITAILIATVLATACAGAVGVIEKDRAEYVPIAVTNGAGEAMATDGTANALPERMTFHAEAAAAETDDEATPRAATRITLTATVSPADSINTEVDWSVEFVNPSSAWATGKTASSYITVTPASDGALTATVSNSKAFEEQIRITVALRSNPEIKAECICDYEMKIASAVVRVAWNHTEFSLGSGTENQIDFTELAGNTTADSLYPTHIGFVYTGGTIANEKGKSQIAKERVLFAYDLNWLKGFEGVAGITVPTSYTFLDVTDVYGTDPAVRLMGGDLLGAMFDQDFYTRVQEHMGKYDSYKNTAQYLTLQGHAIGYLYLQIGWESGETDTYSATVRYNATSFT